MLNVFECCYKYLKNLLFDPFWLSVRQGNMFVKPYWIVHKGMKSEFCCIVQFGQMYQNQQVNDSRPTVATRDHGATTRDRNGCDSRPRPSNSKQTSGTRDHQGLDSRPHRDNSRRDSRPPKLRVMPAPLETNHYKSRPPGCDSRPHVLESRPPCLDWAAHFSYWAIT